MNEIKKEIKNEIKEAVEKPDLHLIKLGNIKYISTEKGVELLKQIQDMFDRMDRDEKQRQSAVNSIRNTDERVKVKIPYEDILGHTENLEYITNRKGSAFLKEQIMPDLLEETQSTELIENLSFLDGVLLTWNIFNKILDERLRDENGEPEQGISEGHSYDYLGIINDDIASLLRDKVLEHGYLKSRGEYLCNQFDIVL